MGASYARGRKSRRGIVWPRRGKSPSSVVIILTLTGGRSKFYPGKISRDRRDGTYDISYEDGEHETRVKEEFIKTLDSDSDDDRRSSSTKIREGDKCEAEFKNTGKFYPGTVKRVHGDGTCDIVFDDGDKQSYVEASRIKVKGGGQSRSRSRSRSRSPSRGRMRVGTRVEARYRY